MCSHSKSLTVNVLAIPAKTVPSKCLDFLPAHSRSILLCALFSALCPASVRLLPHLLPHRPPFRYYDGSGCNTVYSFDGELNAYCYVEGAESNFYAYPTAYHYDGNSGCSGVPSYTYALNDNANECLLQTDINDDDSLNPSYSYLTLANSVPPKYSNDDDDLSGGAIAGISIGCVAFVGIVCALMYYFFIAKQAPMAAAAATPATATVSARATPVVVHATPTKPGVPVNEI